MFVEIFIRHQALDMLVRTEFREVRPEVSSSSRTRRKRNCKVVRQPMPGVLLLAVKMGRPQVLSRWISILKDIFNNEQYHASISSLTLCDFLNESDEKGQTPLIHACFDGYHDIVEILLSAGASIAIQDSSGSTAVHWAYAMGHMNLGDFVAQKCRKQYSQSQEVDIDALQDDDGHTIQWWRDQIKVEEQIDEIGDIEKRTAGNEIVFDSPSTLEEVLVAATKLEQMHNFVEHMGLTAQVSDKSEEQSKIVKGEAQEVSLLPPINGSSDFDSDFDSSGDDEKSFNNLAVSIHSEDTVTAAAVPTSPTVNNTSPYTLWIQVPVLYE